MTKTKPARDPSIIAEVCARCLKGQYSYFEQDLPFDTYLYVDYFNNLARQDTENGQAPVDMDFASILEKQLEYEIEAIKAQNEIRRCTHNYLFYLMRHNKIFSMECHNCHQEIIMDDCSCDNPIIIDFVDTNEQGDELNRDTFCIKCQGYVLSNLDHLK